MDGSYLMQCSSMDSIIIPVGSDAGTALPTDSRQQEEILSTSELIFNEVQCAFRPPEYVVMTQSAQNVGLVGVHREV